MKTVIVLTLSPLLMFCMNLAFQQSTLLEDLEGALFSNNRETVLITDIYDCDNQIIDSTHLVRKIQPKATVVLDILEAISLTKDTSLIAQLQTIYNKHLEFVKIEWEAIFQQNIYMCEAGKEQFRILTGFEMALHALYMEKLNLSAQEKYKYHKDYMQLIYTYIFDISNREEALKQLPHFSSYTQKLRKNGWVAHAPDFGYLTPFLPEIEQFFIENLMVFSFDTISGLNTEEYFATHSTRYLEKIQNPKIDTVFYQRFDHWAEANRQPWIYSISGKTERENQWLIEFLTEQLLSNPRITKWKWEYRDYLMRNLFWSQKKKDIVKNYLLKQIESERTDNRTDAIKFMVRFHETEVRDKLVRLSRKRKFSADEKNELQKTVTYLDNLLKKKQ